MQPILRNGKRLDCFCKELWNIYNIPPFPFLTSLKNEVESHLDQQIELFTVIFHNPSWQLLHGRQLNWMRTLPTNLCTSNQCESCMHWEQVHIESSWVGMNQIRNIPVFIRVRGLTTVPVCLVWQVGTTQGSCALSPPRPFYIPSLLKESFGTRRKP